ncbi:MAG: 16S rRNA processing protein RimM [Clostridia bacterium]|nr:16S rRNA processing protein RimM [Clostridia bacterium]
MNLLEIGKIVRPHGVKGAVKIMCYLDEGLSKFKHVYLTNKRISANIQRVQSLNNDAYAVYIDNIVTIDDAEKYRNQSVYIDRDEYDNMKDRIYMSDLIGSEVRNENGEKIGEMVDYDDYGASVILTIRCGAVSYSIPYVEDIIVFDREKNSFVINQQTFEDMKV